MTTKEMAEALGIRGYIPAPGMTIEVKVCDVKTSYGQVRYQVTPIARTGSVWVSAERFTPVL